MDTTIVSTMLYTISDEFGGFRMSSWIVLAYTLSYVGKHIYLLVLSNGKRAYGCLVQAAPYL